MRVHAVVGYWVKKAGDVHPKDTQLSNTIATLIKEEYKNKQNKRFILMQN